MNNNNLKTVAPATLKFDSVFASSRWQSALFKLECFHSSKLKSAMTIIAEAACDDEAGLAVDFSKVFAALELVNDETQTWWNANDPLSL